MLQKTETLQPVGDFDVKDKDNQLENIFEAKEIPTSKQNLKSKKGPEK